LGGEGESLECRSAIGKDWEEGVGRRLGGEGDAPECGRRGEGLRRRGWCWFGSPERG
jgi:hypothetical protein